MRPVLPPSNIRNKWERVDLQPNDVLREIYRSEEVVDSTGTVHKFKDGVDPIEGILLYNLVRDNPWMRRSLEIGCGFGTSALFIAQALKDAGAQPTRAPAGKGGSEEEAFHMALDPHQGDQYNGVGALNVDRAGLADYFFCAEMRSCDAVPALAREVHDGDRPYFHLIFIDGWHTFDFTFIDFFFADQLLAEGGVIVLAALKHKGVAKVVEFVKRNFSHFEVVEAPCRTMGVFVKVGSNDREWFAHEDF